MVTEKTREELEIEAQKVGLTLSYTPVVVIPDIMELGEKNWQETMKEGIGSSGAAAAIGKSPYKTAVETALEKIYGCSKPIGTDPDAQYRLDSGHMQETPLLKWYARKLGYEIALVDPSNPSTSEIQDISKIPQETLERLRREGKGMVCVDRARYAHPDYPFLFTDMDGVCIKPDGEVYVLECKTAKADEYKWNWHSGVWGMPMTSVGNPGYIDQARQHMAVSNSLRCDIIANCGFTADSIVVVTVFRDMEEERKLIDGEEKLWNDVINKRVPVFTSLSDRSYENVEYILTKEKENEELWEMNGESAPAVTELLETTQKIEGYKALMEKEEERANALKAKILSLMGDHQNAIYRKPEMGEEILFSVSSRKTTTFNRKKYEMEHPLESQAYIQENVGEMKLKFKVKSVS